MKEDKKDINLQAFQQWDRDGRRENGEMWSMLLHDDTGRYIPRNDELELAMDCHDGFAVGNDGVMEYVMTYPTMQQVMASPALQQRIVNYVGQAVTDTDICLGDVALTLGKLVQAQPYRQQVAEAEKLVANTPDWLIYMAWGQVADRVTEYKKEVTEPRIVDIRARWNDLQQSLARKAGVDSYADIQRIADNPQRTPEEKRVFATYMEQQDRYLPYTMAATKSVNQLYEDFTNRCLADSIRAIRKELTRMDDIRLVHHTNGDVSIRCKIDSEQQPMRRVNKAILQEVGPSNIDQPDTVRGLAERLFAPDLVNAPQQTRTQGIKR